MKGSGTEGGYACPWQAPADEHGGDRGHARLVWTGSLAFGLVNVPVGLYSAAQDKTIRFHQFERGTARTGAQVVLGAPGALPAATARWLQAASVPPPLLCAPLTSRTTCDLAAAALGHPAQ